MFRYPKPIDQLRNSPNPAWMRPQTLDMRTRTSPVAYGELRGDSPRWMELDGWPGGLGNASPRKKGCLLNFVNGKLMMKWMELGELGCSHILYFKRSHMSLGKLQEFHNSQVRNRSILQRFLFTDWYSIFTLYGNSRRTKEFDVMGKGFISFAYYHEKQASIALLVAVVGRSSLEQLTLDRAWGAINKLIYHQLWWRWGTLPEKKLFRIPKFAVNGWTSLGVSFDTPFLHEMTWTCPMTLVA